MNFLSNGYVCTSSASYVFWKFEVMKFLSISGPQLPIGLEFHSMVPFGNGQAIIGGYNGYHQGKIYHVTCANRQCKITKMDQELAIPRHNFVAIPIPDDISGCTWESKIS